MGKDIDISTFTHAQLVEWVKKTRPRELVNLMVIEDFDAILNIDCWLQIKEGPQSYVATKFDEAVYEAIIKKIKLLSSGDIDIDSFTNQELIDFVDPHIEFEGFKENINNKVAYDILSERIRRLKENAIVNAIDDYTKQMGMNEREIKKLISDGNNNMFDILIRIVNLDESEEKYYIIEDLLDGNFYPAPLKYYDRLMDEERFRVKDLFQGRLFTVNENGKKVLRKNYYETVYELKPDINPLLLGLSGNYKEGAYYKAYYN